MIAATLECPKHRCPTRECEGVQLTRARHVPMCLCAHPKAVHRGGRVGLDCGLCGCRYYETARSVRWRDMVSVFAWLGCGLFCAAFWIALIFGVRAVIGR